MKKTFALAAALLLACASVQAADIAAGKAKAEAQCAACHAANNDWNKPVDPSYPKLAGQHKDYLAHALKEYQSGGRKNAIMAGMAAALSKDDIDNLTAYFASLNGDLYLRK
ncbi:MAG TPA: cytochrome c [Limnobacter sp.]|uniref:c-type cytochrome n=1 Tax=Limnobacter sp. TaxID=2003368 RepID=UPI002EDB9343